MKKLIQALVALAVLGLGIFWVVTTPFEVTSPALPDHVANLENGRLLFNAGGCVSCHAPFTEQVEQLIDQTPVSPAFGLVAPSPHLEQVEQLIVVHWHGKNIRDRRSDLILSSLRRLCRVRDRLLFGFATW